MTATTRKGGLALKVFTEVAQLAELEADWERLIKQLPAPSPFISPRWIIPWLEVYGPEGEILVLAAYRKNELAGLCPLILRQGKFLRLPARLLEFAGSPLSDRMDMIIPERKEEVVELFWDYLWEVRSRWDVVRLGEIPAGSFNLTVTGDLLRDRKIRHTFRTCSICPFILLDQDWEAYLQSRSKQFRKRVRGDLKRIKRAGEVRLQEAKVADWKLFREISLDSPKARRGTSLFLRPGIDRFLPVFLEKFEEAGWLNCKLLTLDGEPIAYKLNFKFQNKIWLFNSSFRSSYGSLHPGYVIMALLIQDSIKNSFREMDYLRGAEPFKYHYTNEIRYHREIIVFNRAFRPDLLRALFAVKTALKRLLGKETRLPGKGI
ncbi:MAG: GNAT family N-acetyltransferase [Candidatus Erginobacter occultus]|nr:GNAT family N-acetyltransferase [Candidatus Erginobacter occultus]